ncbi:hypothetical protein [Puniceicoccus vermicola]|uniref:Lipoprotein n=1 Tax=Puniceicoccus vermicola TaxID=388746 RepID=A0A7X1AXU1_9BACT|nr:hypothetical protein [Puniceicoccus vermicola]MBC2601988.1 hypothetical protein [Puniceicoccus vermicola]
MILKIFIYLFGMHLLVCGCLYSKNFYDHDVANYIVEQVFEGDRLFAVVKRYEHGSGNYSAYRFEDGSRIWGEIPPGEKVSEFRLKNSIRPLVVEADFCGKLDSTVFIGTPERVVIFGEGNPTYVGMSGSGSRWFVIGEKVVDANGNLKKKFEERYRDVANAIPLKSGRLIHIDEPLGLNIYSLKFTRAEKPSYLVELSEIEMNDLSKILSAICSLRANIDSLNHFDRSSVMMEDFIELEEEIRTEFGVEVFKSCMEQLTTLQSGVR